MWAEVDGVEARTGLGQTLFDPSMGPGKLSFGGSATRDTRHIRDKWRGNPRRCATRTVSRAAIEIGVADVLMVDVQHTVSIEKCRAVRAPR